MILRTFSERFKSLLRLGCGCSRFALAFGVKIFRELMLLGHLIRNLSLKYISIKIMPRVSTLYSEKKLIKEWQYVITSQQIT